MDYIKINGRAFDVGVGISNYEENFNVLDGPNAGRSTGSGRMIRDVLGTCIGHKITFFYNGNRAAFDALWDYLLAHSIDDSVQLTAADGQTTISYEAYYSSGKRSLKQAHNGVNYWDELEVNFVPIAPQLAR